MTAAQFRQFLEGVAVAWDIDAEISIAGDAAGLAAEVRTAGRPICRIKREQQPFGIVWQIDADGARVRSHPSIQGAIRSIAAILAPDRPMGRVMFATGMDGAP